MRNYINADVEWPREVPEPSVTILIVERILTDLQLSFSSNGVRDVLNALRQYSLDAYNEINNPKKEEQKKTIKELRSSALEFQEKLRAYTGIDPDTHSSEIYIDILRQLALLEDLLILQSKRLTTIGQGKGGGPQAKTALMMLTQRLIVIYKRETHQKFSAGPNEEDVEWARIGWGRVRKEYNPSAKNYLSLLISLVDPSQASDLKKIVNSVTKKRYRPDIDLK